MKSFFYLLCAISLFTLLSCKDAEEAETNTRKTDQTKDVIMPLAVGNTWIYKHTKYDDSSHTVKAISYDSIVVLSTTSIDGVEYYKTRFPLFDASADTQTYMNYNLVNFTAGLQWKDTSCACDNWNRVHYPDLTPTYMYFKNIYKSSIPINGSMIDTVIDIKFMSSILGRNNYSVGAGTFDCIKYSYWYDISPNLLRITYGRSDEYYSPNNGLIYAIIFGHSTYGTNDTTDTYELISKSLK